VPSKDEPEKRNRKTNCRCFFAETPVFHVLNTDPRTLNTLTLQINYVLVTVMLFFFAYPLLFYSAILEDSRWAAPQEKYDVKDNV